MQKYEENLAANTSGALRPLSGASVTVTDQATGLPASLYSDNGVTQLAQPLTTDNDGYFAFYAPDSKYTLTFTGPRFAQFTRQVVLEDPDDNPYATLAALAAGSGAMLVRHNDALVGDVLDDLIETVDGIEAGVTYELPIASPTVLGGVKLGANLTANAGGVVSAGLTNGAVVSALASAATAPRTHTFPNKTGTVAHLDDISAPGAMVLLGQATVTTPVANIDFLSIFTSAYDKYVIEVVGVQCSSDSQLSLRLAIAGEIGAASTGTNYVPLIVHGQNVSTAPSGTSIALNVAAASASVQPPITFTVTGVNNTTGVAKGITACGVGRSSTNYTGIDANALFARTEVVTGFRLFWSSGVNFVGGTIRIYGIKNT